MFMHYLLPCNNSKSTRPFLEYPGMARVFARYESQRGHMEYNEEINNQTPCKKKMCGRKYVKRGIVKHRTFWKNFYNPMPKNIADLIKAKGGATKYRLHGVGVQVCCCVFFKMYLSNNILCTINLAIVLYG